MSEKQIQITQEKSRTLTRAQQKTASEHLAVIMPAWGCPTLIPLDKKFQRPEQVDYLDLLPKADHQHGVGLHAVAAHRGAALLYLVDAERSQRLTDKKIQEMQHTLANRSESAWLGIVKSGTLELYPVQFGDALPTAKKIQKSAADAPIFFQSLVQGTFSAEVKPQASDYVYQKIRDLLKHTTEKLVKDHLVEEPLHVLSMAGRALFFRFLIDRDIVRRTELKDVCPDAAAAGAQREDAFSSAIRAAQTSAWLDETFNGDFLPLIPDALKGEERLKAYTRFYRDLGKQSGGAIFTHLEAILKGWEHVNGGYQPLLDWNDLDFAHIPVGVLSEVYEHFSHLVDPRLSKDKSVHYTPRYIAHFMVEEAFTAMQGDKAQARVLDPASGAGIFLVLSFRRLFMERYAVTGKRPDKDVIQDILYKQIRGFDVSESALRLAALALYITAIELNASPHPPKELKFPRNLRGSVLHHFGDETARQVYEDADEAAFQSLLGSLGDLPGRMLPDDDLTGAFDLVIGNPPWTRLRDETPEERKEKTGSTGRVKNSATEKANHAFSKIGREALKAKGLNHRIKDYKNPDKAPDIPFLWRAAQWAKPGAMLVFALHARLFLHTQGKKDIAWHSLQEALAITGIINGADLRKTPVWENMDIPWCLFFARNEIAEATPGFYFTTPHYERSINATCRFRIDYAAVRAITQQEIKRHPWLLKTLSLGTTLDVEVMSRISKASPYTLEKYWEQFDPEGDRNGQGYNISPGLSQKPAAFLGKLLDFEDPSEYGFAIEWDKLKTYQINQKRSSAYRPKTPAQYQPPLVIVPKAPGEELYTPKAWLAERPVAFSQSYYGYACQDSPAPQPVAALIHVLAHSTLARYFIVMSSASLGSDFMMFLKADFDALPFPDPAKFSTKDKKKLLALSQRLQAGEGQMPPPPEKAKKTKAKAGKKQSSASGHDELGLFAPSPESAATPASPPNKQREKALAFWQELNDFIYHLYGLGAEDAQVIEDTLFASAPYRRAGEAAFLPTEPQAEETGPSTRELFCAELQERLQPFFQVTGETVHVGEPLGLRQQTWDATWRFVAVWTGEASTQIPAGVIQQGMADANAMGLSRIIVRLPHGQGLLIGILDARRWWTRTRARLCAHTITMEHLSAFDKPRLSYDPLAPRKRILG